MKITIQKGTLGNKKGWNFSVYYENRTYPNLISALYKTKREIQSQVDRFKKDGSYSSYGSAE